MGVIDGRTGLEMLSVPECWRLLATGEVGRLAVSVDGDPDVVPVNYVVTDRELVFRTAIGTKSRALEHHPWVAIEVDDFDAETRSGWSVQVKGHAEVVRDPKVLARLRSSPPIPWAAGEKPVWVRVAPVEIVGRRIAPSPPNEG